MSRAYRHVASALISVCVFAVVALPAAAATPGRLAIAPVSGKGLVISAPDGRSAHRVCISALCAGADDPSWSADGRELAFSVPCDRGGCVPQLVVGEPDGRCANCKSTNGFPEPLGRGLDPTLQGARGLTAAVVRGQLVSASLDGRWQAVLATDGVTAGTVSHRGTIAVVRDRAIWVGARGDLRRIAAGTDPAWSSSGGSIAFVHAGMITVASASGHRARRLVAGRDPSWSPDGHRIAFIGAKNRVMVVSVLTGRAHRIGRLRGRSVAWGPSPKPARCLTPVGAQTISTSVEGTVYETAGGQYGIGKSLIGCASPDGIARILFSLGVASANSLEQTLTDGRFAGFLVSFDDAHYSVAFDRVTVYDLRTGQESPTLGGERSPTSAANYEVGGSLDDLVMNASGDTAVHATEVFAPPAPTGSDFYKTEAILASSGAGVRTIATAPANSTATTLANLRLMGTTLTFTDDGATESAQLP